MTLLLASRSEARRRMLAAAGVACHPVATDFDEEAAKPGLLAAGFASVDLAEMLAEGKALGAATAPGDLVIGADQVLETENGTVLDKAASLDEARNQLRSLAGRTHWLHSAAVVVANGARLWGVTESAELAMRSFSDDFLEDYLAREYGEVRRNVGAYRIEGPGVQLFESIEGSHFAILGLPLLPLLAFLRERGVLPA